MAAAPLNCGQQHKYEMEKGAVIPVTLMVCVRVCMCMCVRACMLACVCVSSGAPAWTLRQETWSWTVASRTSPLPSSASPPHLPTRLTRASPRLLLPSQASSATPGPPPTPRTMSRSPPYNLWPGPSGSALVMSTFPPAPGPASWDPSDQSCVSGWILSFSLFSALLNSVKRTKSETEEKKAAGKQRRRPKDFREDSEFHLRAFLSPCLHHVKASDLFFTNGGRWMVAWWGKYAPACICDRIPKNTQPIS